MTKPQIHTGPNIRGIFEMKSICDLEMFIFWAWQELQLRPGDSRWAFIAAIGVAIAPEWLEGAGVDPTDKDGIKLAEARAKARRDSCPYVGVCFELANVGKHFMRRSESATAQIPTNPMTHLVDCATPSGSHETLRQSAILVDVPGVSKEMPVGEVVWRALESIRTWMSEPGVVLDLPRRGPATTAKPTLSAGYAGPLSGRWE